jgi:ubiquinol-cytochrome c reductase cytochrome c subunit
VIEMQIVRIAAVILLAALIMAAADAAKGKRLYTDYGCYQCHGRQGQGSSGTGPRLGPNPLAYPAFQAYVRRPTAQMPPYTVKVVSDAELADIYAFVQSLPPPAKSIPLLESVLK